MPQKQEAGASAPSQAVAQNETQCVQDRGNHGERRRPWDCWCSRQRSAQFLVENSDRKVARTRHRAQHLGTVSGGAAVPGAGRAAGADIMAVHGIGSGRRAMAVHVLRTGGSRPHSHWHALPKTSRAALSQASNADCASSPRLGLAGNKTIGGGVEGVLGADESVPGQVPAWKKRDPRTSEARRSGH
jgi:hypothetical protein